MAAQSATQVPAPAAIIVMGVSGSGKSTLAAMLAPRLSAVFIEGDALHDAASVAKMSAAQPLDDADREPWLDRIGAALHGVTATGGIAVSACSALKASYRERLRRAAAAPTFFILLDAPIAELSRRMAGRKGHFMPTSLLESQFATLERPASDEALILDAALAPSELCEASCSWLAARRAASVPH